MRIGSIAAAITLTLALAAWYLRADSVGVRAAGTPGRPSVPAIEVSAPVVGSALRAPTAQPVRESPPASKSPDYAAQYLRAADMLGFLEALAPAAADGDVDALYYVARASRRCTREYRDLFGPPGKEKTLEDALATDFWTKYYEQTARRIHAQCARFKAATDNPFTEWRDLLDAAAEAGSGPAKAMLAFEIKQGMIRVRDDESRGQMTGEILTLAKEAIRTKDPEVLYQLAFVETITGNSGTPQDVATVWMLAACLRGLECGRDSEQFQFFCKWDPACQPSETVVDLFRRREGPGFDEKLRLAEELNARLDADRFDEIIP